MIQANHEQQQQQQQRKSFKFKTFCISPLLLSLDMLSSLQVDLLSNKGEILFVSKYVIKKKRNKIFLSAGMMGK